MWDPRQKDTPVANMEPVEGETKRDCWTVAFGVYLQYIQLIQTPLYSFVLLIGCFFIHFCDKVMHSMTRTDVYVLVTTTETLNYLTSETCLCDGRKT